MNQKRSARLPLLAVLAASLLLAGCGDGYGILTPGEDARDRLRPGLYYYRAWSDFGGYGAAWEGYLDLRVDFDGSIYGSYRLPHQCVDVYGYAADCVGRIGGRTYRDGTVRFGFDEGWLANRGTLRGRSRVAGHWDSRLLGYSDSGTFELVPY